MISFRYLVVGGLLVATTASLLFNQTEAVARPEISVGDIPFHGQEPIVPLPRKTDLPEGKVALGERLFRDVRLSRDNTLACAGCHNLDAGGVDGKRFSTGVDAAAGQINAPTVFNSGFNFVQFWDGRAASLEDQVAGPIHNPIEMASNWSQVIDKLNADGSYRQDFARLYPDGMTAANIADAIAVFERSLATPDSPFDRYLRGETHALSADQIEGYRRFKDFGCTSCHQGVNVGGNLFQSFGVMRDYFADQPSIAQSDLGRFNVTDREEDRYVFKVPSLRNVALTAPYFHNGSADTLEAAVATMGRYQLGRNLAPEDQRLIASFLRSLTGQWRGKPLQ